MVHKCELCGKSATLTDRTIINNGLVEYRFCEDCFRAIQKTGKSAFEFMQERMALKGKRCPVCGCTTEDFIKSFMFGCPDCYREMRDIAQSAALSSQGSLSHVGKNPWREP